MPQPNRNFDSQEYRYGFNGKEKDDEIKGAGNSYDYGARLYDPRVGKWLSVDPLAEKTMDPYGYVYNNPINLIDPNGLEPIPVSSVAFRIFATQYGIRGNQ